MINRNSYIQQLQQVAMIESQCQPRKNKPLISTYSRSPLRQNRPNIVNTPARNTPKPSLSPMRSRRNDSSMSLRPPTASMSRRRVDPMCINEPHKKASYLTYSEQQTLYYCQKCAILLASQGFSVSKIQSTESLQINPRKQEVDSFLKQLQSTTLSLNKRFSSLTISNEDQQKSLQQQQAKLQDYYLQFYEIIEEHKRRAMEQLKQQFQSVSRQSTIFQSKLQQALSDSTRMKKDIVESMNIILYESEEQQFRPIMSTYQENLKKYKLLSIKPLPQHQQMRRLQFKDPQAACKALGQGLQMKWMSSNMQSSKQSDIPQNPVQSVDNEQHFTKSSLRQIGNLFSSFDQ